MPQVASCPPSLSQAQSQVHFNHTGLDVHPIRLGTDCLCLASRRLPGTDPTKSKMVLVDLDTRSTSVDTETTRNNTTILKTDRNHLRDAVINGKITTRGVGFHKYNILSVVAQIYSPSGVASTLQMTSRASCKVL
jgi:hypothetical protein